MRVLGLIIGSFVVLIMILATVHFYGLGQKYKPFDHRFLKPPTPWIVTPWEQNFFLEKVPDLILYANVYRNQEGLILVSPSSEKVAKNSGREQIATPARPLLKDLLANFPQARFVLNISDNVMDIDRQVAAVLESEARTERILIQSDFNTVLESIKSLLPLFLYGSTPSDTMRFKSFHSMHVVTATPFKGDIFFSPLLIKSQNTINSEISLELKRRFKKIILGPLTTTDELQLALSLGADGLFVEKPEWALQWLSQNPQ